MQNSTITNKEQAIIANNEKWFSFFRILPMVVTIVLAIACFVLGIVFNVIMYDPIFILIFWGGGAIIDGLTYVVLKTCFSYKILHIYLLKRIISKQSTKNLEKPEVLPKI